MKMNCSDLNRNHYYGYEEGNAVIQDIKLRPGKHDIIGHSWGGTTAIKVTKQLAESDISVNNLITLDPVSWLPQSNPNNQNTWINVYQNQTPVDYLSSIPIVGNAIGGIMSMLNYFGGSGDTIATIGGQLGSEAGAINIPTSLPHADANGMYNIANNYLNSSSSLGGFVLYPNKPNLNMIRSVYKK
ncbi:MAG: hypothetical protein HQK75_10530 [Candidatus Magnetomorum sp.]|nr:hypothetical protein [Candidatus Magnetomorum sp.]